MSTKNLPKWTEERTEQLVAIVGAIGEPVSAETVAQAAVELDTTTRSVAGKLRKMGYTTQAAAASAPSYTDEETESLNSFVTANPGKYTYAEIAENVFRGRKTAKSVQGKMLSMDLSSLAKKAEPKVSVKTYTEAEEATFVEMSNKGSYIEDIAAALGKEVNSIRGKALSLLNAGAISSVPKMREVKPKVEDGLETLGSKIANMTVAEIAESIGKSVRGVKTMLTHRSLTAADYDGASKKEKINSKVA